MIRRIMQIDEKNNTLRDQHNSFFITEAESKNPTSKHAYLRPSANPGEFLFRLAVSGYCSRLYCSRHSLNDSHSELLARSSLGRQTGIDPVFTPEENMAQANII